MTHLLSSFISWSSFRARDQIPFRCGRSSHVEGFLLKVVDLNFRMQWGKAHLHPAMVFLLGFCSGLLGWKCSQLGFIWYKFPQTYCWNQQIFQHSFHLPLPFRRWLTSSIEDIGLQIALVILMRKSRWYCWKNFLVSRVLHRLLSFRTWWCYDYNNLGSIQSWYFSPI